MDIDKMFDDMAGAAINDKGEFFSAGLYRCTVDSLELRDGHKGISFIAKLKVVESNNGTPAGVTRSWILRLDNKETKDQVMGDIKGFIFAVKGLSPRQVPSPEKNPKVHEDAVKLFKAAIDPEFAKKNNINPGWALDKPVNLEATVVKTKKDKDFTRHSWARDGALPANSTQTENGPAAPTNSTQAEDEQTAA
jgi:hypothetical protein